MLPNTRTIMGYNYLVFCLNRKHKLDICCTVVPAEGRKSIVSIKYFKDPVSI